jgi:hypothetical protein
MEIFLKKDITFFILDTAEQQLYTPIIEEAQKRGYTTLITDEPKKQCEIGVYCQHVNYPENSKFSVIMLHDLIQAYPRWPDIWEVERWDKYDIGMLPAKFWIDMWKNASHNPWAKPRLGIYEVGWPKADTAIKREFTEAVKKLSDELNLDKTKKTVLYAPSWENDNKQDDYIQAMLPLDVNILVKQYHMEKEWAYAHNWSVYRNLYDSIQEMKNLHNNIPNVHILDTKTNILHAIAIADILVSEESSTMCEAVLMEKPAVAVEDWLIPDTIPPRTACKGHAFTIKAKKETLKETVKDVLERYEFYCQQAIEFKNNNFMPIGDNAKKVMDIIDTGYNLTLNNYLPSGRLASECKVTIPIRSGRFYFDTGKNFNEGETVHFNYSNETNHFYYEIILPQDTKAIRFDPVEGYCCFVQNLVFKSDSGNPVDYQILNGFKSENNGIVFITTDPQILIVADESEIRKIEVQCDIWFFN